MFPPFKNLSNNEHGCKKCRYVDSKKGHGIKDLILCTPPLGLVSKYNDEESVPGGLEIPSIEWPDFAKRTTV